MLATILMSMRNRKKLMHATIMRITKRSQYWLPKLTKRKSVKLEKTEAHSSNDFEPRKVKWVNHGSPVNPDRRAQRAPPVGTRVSSRGPR
jgi:hypothetical protein